MAKKSPSAPPHTLPEFYAFGRNHLDINTREVCFAGECSCYMGCNSCRRIASATVDSVDLDVLYREIICQIGAISTVHRYCIERLLRIYRAYEPSRWTARIGDGYYGQEVVGANFAQERPLIADINALALLNTDEQKIVFILAKEYGYLLPVLQGCAWSVETVTAKQLTPSNKEYYKKCDPSAYPKDLHQLPLGIYLHECGRYRLIDGYNRFAGIISQKDPDDTVSIIVARKRR